MVDDKSTHAPADEPQPDTAVSPSGEASDTPKRTSVWRGAVRVIGEVAVNLLIGGLPFFAAGVFWLSSDDLSSQTAELAWGPWAVISVGAAIVLVGSIASLISRPRLSLLPGERRLAVRHPSMMPPFTRIAIGVLVFAAGGYLLWFTDRPYIYPYTVFMVGLYLYLKGFATYLINRHTAYYATNYRVVSMYQFLSQAGTEIPIDSVNSVKRVISPIARLTGRGDVRAASGIGADHKVDMRDIDNPVPMIDAIRRGRLQDSAG